MEAVRGKIQGSGGCVNMGTSRPDWEMLGQSRTVLKIPKNGGTTKGHVKN